MFRIAIGAAALSTVIAGAALADDSKVVVPSAGGAVTAPTTPGAVVTVPTPNTMSASTPEATAAGFPTFESMANDQTVAETLMAQGYTDVKIFHDGTLMRVNANRDGKPIELVYQTTTGQLVKLNGQPVLNAEQAKGESGHKDEAGAKTDKPESGDKPDSGEKPDSGDKPDGSGNTGGSEGSEGGTEGGSGGASNG